MRKLTRHDAVNRTLPEGERYDGAEAARQRMLERRGLAGGKSEPAAKARQRMLDRHHK